MPIITALFVTLRYADYYSIELLQSLRQKCDLRVVVAVPTPGTGLPRALEGWLTSCMCCLRTMAMDCRAYSNPVRWPS